MTLRPRLWDQAHQHKESRRQLFQTRSKRVPSKRFPFGMTAFISDSLIRRGAELARRRVEIALRANISETLPVVVINEQGEEEKNKDEQEFSWCCLRGRGWRGTKRRRA